jgi:hypothetical protein
MTKRRVERVALIGNRGVTLWMTDMDFSLGDEPAGGWRADVMYRRRADTSTVPRPIAPVHVM